MIYINIIATKKSKTQRRWYHLMTDFADEVTTVIGLLFMLAVLYHVYFSENKKNGSYKIIFVAGLFILAVGVRLFSNT